MEKMEYWKLQKLYVKVCCIFIKGTSRSEQPNTSLHCIASTLDIDQFVLSFIHCNISVYCVLWL